MTKRTSDSMPEAAHAHIVPAGPPDSPPENVSVLMWLTNLVSARPRLWLAGILLTVIAAVWFTVTHLQFATDRADLIDPQAIFHQRWLRYAESFGETSDLVVVVQADSAEQIKQVLDHIGPQFETSTEEFSDVLYKVDSRQLQRKALQYATPNQLLKTLDQLEQMEDVLKGDWSSLTLNGIMQKMFAELQQLTSREQPPQQPHSAEHLTQATSLMKSLTHYLQTDGEFVSPFPDDQWEDTAELNPETTVHLLNEEGTVGFIKARPIVPDNALKGAEAAVAKARTIVTNSRQQFPDVSIGLTGIPVLEHDEMTLSEQDMTFASVISFLAVGVLMLIGFRGLKHPAMAMLMLVAGMCWSFAFATIAVGHLNILSISFAAILIGLGIDFAIHYLAHYIDHRQEGLPTRQALAATSDGVGSGILAAAMTTALAFGCATFTSFLGVAELGLIAAGGILLCGLATFVVLPALLSWADANSPVREMPIPFRGEWLRTLIDRAPALLVIAGLSLVTTCAWYGWDFSQQVPVSRVKYDPNLMNLQPVGLEAVEVQQKLKEHSSSSLLYAVSLAKTPLQARRLRDQFEALPTVDRVVDLASRLPDHPISDIKLYLQGIHSLLNFLPDAVPPTDQVSPQQFGSMLEVVFQQLEPLASEAPELEDFIIQLDLFLNQLDAIAAQQQGELLNDYQASMRQQVWKQLKQIKEMSDPEPITLADFPHELLTRYVSTKGEWLLQVYPVEDIWQPAELEDFVTDIRTVDPEVTGNPLQNYEASRQIQDSYLNAATMALCVIVLVLIIDFLPPGLYATLLGLPILITALAVLLLQLTGWKPSLMSMLIIYAVVVFVMTLVLRPVVAAQTILSMLPPILGGAMMLGLLGLLGVDFNPANLIVLPLILGIGVDDGVHVVHDFRRSSDRYIPSGSTINAITLTSLTSMIGFGSLIMAAHRGLSSLGLVLVIGVGSCLFVSLIVLPGLLQLLGAVARKPNLTAVAVQPVTYDISTEIADDEPVNVDSH